MGFAPWRAANFCQGGPQIITPEFPPESFYDPYYFPVHLAFVAALGACFGSFFNVCIYRIPLGVPLSIPPSHCYQCGQPLKWYHNLPLITYWVLRGRCGYCGSRYSIRYFLIELLTAALFLLVFVRSCNPTSGYGLAFIPGMVFLSLLLIASFTDVDHWIIPDRISIGGAVAGIALAAVWPLGLAPHSPLAVDIYPIEIPKHFLPLVNSLVGAVTGYGLLWGIGFVGTLVFRKDAMGMGDVKLAAMFGSFLGPINCFIVFMIACGIGSVLGILFILLNNLLGGQPVPAAAGPLVPDEARITRGTASLHGPEWLTVMRALLQPGTSGPARHQLIFGPPLAVAALIVWLAWEPIQFWIRDRLMLAPF